MYKISLSWHNRLKRGEFPVPYILVSTKIGIYAYGNKELSNLLLGQVDNLLVHSAKVKSFGEPKKTISPVTHSLLTSFTTKQLSNLTVVLDNNDNEISRAMVVSPFLGGALSLSLGFEGDALNDHLNLFTGLIKRIRVNQSEVILEANEG